MSKELDSAWWALRIGLGLGPFLAGLDKFFNILANWEMYLSWTRLGAYVAMVWLVAIAINLATTGMFFDLAVRDVEIAIGAYALARLTEVRESAAVPAGSRVAQNNVLANASR